MTLRRMAAGLVALLRKRRLEHELEGEILAHLELAERDALARGLPPEEARLAARREFGGIQQVKEQHREQRSAQWMETILRDVRYGVASLARNPGFTAIVVAVLAIGIGANVAMFSLVDAVLLKPIPFPQPDRIVRVWEAPRAGASNSTSTLDFLDWRRLNKAFEAMSAEVTASAALIGGGEPKRLQGRLVTSDYFKVFQPAVKLGRTFRPDDDQPGSDLRIVLSHAAWQTHFGGDPDILNRRPVLDGQAHEVVGVLAPGAFDRDAAAYWKPLAFRADQLTRGYHWLLLYGRLRPGITPQQAQEEMRTIRTALSGVTPAWKMEWKIMVEQLDRLLVGDTLRRSILIAFGAVAVVLLIACANVANLLLAKGASRRKEMAIRAALGAGRGRLMGQLLTESLLLGLLGGAAGVGLALLLTRAAMPVLLQSLPYTADVRIDLRVLLFACAVALSVALLVGLLPSLKVSSGNLSHSLNQATRGSSNAHHRIRGAIVIGEVALSLVLVCCGILLFRSLFNLQKVETGVQIDNVVTMSADLPANLYDTPEKAAAFYESVAQRLAGAPGVVRAGLASTLPLQWIGNGEPIEVPGLEQPINIRLKRVDPGYFEALGIPLLAGRGITNYDRAGSPRVMVINEALSVQLKDVTGLKNPVGQTVKLNVPHYIAKGAAAMETQIAGVISSERVSNPGSPEPPVVYVPVAQAPPLNIHLIIHTQADPATVMPGIREAIRQADPNLPFGNIATMRQVRASTLAGASRPAWLIGVFAAIAAFLAGLGLYGVLSHSVTQRRKEIGIRMALGARSVDVLAHVLRNALGLVSVGLVIGIAGAMALTEAVRSLLFGVSPLDPVALGAACLSMTLIGLLAAFIPASRAAHVDPMTTLREEG